MSDKYKVSVLRKIFVFKNIHFHHSLEEKPMWPSP